MKTISQKLWPVESALTNKQTNKQTSEATYLRDFASNKIKAKTTLSDPKWPLFAPKRGWNWAPFRSTASRFRDNDDQSCGRVMFQLSDNRGISIQKARMTKLLLQYSTLPSGVQIELRFALRPAVSEITEAEVSVEWSSGSWRVPHIFDNNSKTVRRRAKPWSFFFEDQGLMKPHTKFQTCRSKIEVRTDSWKWPILKWKSALRSGSWSGSRSNCTWW